MNTSARKEKWIIRLAYLEGAFVVLAGLWLYLSAHARKAGQLKDKIINLPLNRFDREGEISNILR